jgi:hypothetical protein
LVLLACSLLPESAAASIASSLPSHFWRLNFPRI